MKQFLGALLATLPLLVAQAPTPKPAPKKVDAALRSRVTEFHQYMIDGTFRRALDMVAQDSQDFFLSTSKNKQTVFKIEEITYSDKFTKAVVRISTTYRTLVGFHAIELPTTLPDYWKLVGGKWMWYHDPAADRPNFFGVPVGDASKPESILAQAVPKDTSNQALGAAAQSVLQGTPGPVLDKNSMEFVLGTPGEQQVMVRNPYRGQVRVAASLVGPPLGVSADPDVSVIDSLGTTAVTIHYDPQLSTVPGSTVVRLEIQPFRRVFSLSVNIVRTPTPGASTPPAPALSADPAKP